MERKLAAVLFADVVGSCRMMAADELRTLSDIKSLHSKVIRPCIDSHHGRIVRLLGDGLFAEFASVVDAVNCAASFQATLAKRNKGVEANRQILFRVGIHFGDVIVDDDDLFGNGVNIAARLEALARHGGVLISERVFEEVKEKTSLVYRFAGTRRLKNVPGPVSSYEVRIDGLDEHETPGKTQAYRVPLIAVLPFQALDDEAKQDRIVRCINEELAYELSRFSDMSVVAAESVRDYGHPDYTIPEIGQSLGVNYLVTGSTILDSGRLRLFVRLFDSHDGSLLWTERYHRETSNIFALQDEIARDLASRLPLRIERASLARIRQTPTENLDAYECYLQGRELYRKKTRETDIRAIDLLQKAIKIDPEFAEPYAILGAIRAIRWAYSNWGIDPGEDIAAGRALILHALELNNELPRAHGHLGWTYLYTREFDKADKHLNIAVSLNPNDVDVLLLKAYALCYLGEPEESIRICEELMRLNPQHPLWYMDALATAQFVAGRYEESQKTFENVRDLFPENLGWMAACQAYRARWREARHLAEEFVRRIGGIWGGAPEATAEDYVDWWIYKASSFRFQKDADALARGIHLALSREDAASMKPADSASA